MDKPPPPKDSSKKKKEMTSRQRSAEHVSPDLSTGEGTISQPLRKKYEERKAVTKMHVRAWDTHIRGKLTSTVELVQQMKKIAQGYQQELNELNNTGNSLIRSEKPSTGLAGRTIEHINLHAGNAMDMTLTSEARQQSFSMLAVNIDLLEYLTRRLKHPDQLIRDQSTLDVSETLVKNARQILNDSLGSGSIEDDIANENTTSSKVSDESHPPQVSHYLLPDYRNCKVIILAAEESREKIDINRFRLPEKAREDFDRACTDFQKRSDQLDMYYIPDKESGISHTRDDIRHCFRDFKQVTDQIFHFKELIEQDMLDARRKICRENEKGKTIAKCREIRLAWINSEDVPEKQKSSEMIFLERDMIYAGREICRIKEKGETIAKRREIRLAWINSEDVPEKQKKFEGIILEKDMLDAGRKICRENEKGKTIARRIEIRLAWINSEYVPKEQKKLEEATLEKDMLDAGRKICRENGKGENIAKCVEIRLAWINSEYVPKEQKSSEMILLKRDMLYTGEEICRENEKGKTIAKRREIRLAWINSEYVPEKQKPDKTRILDRDMNKIREDIQRWERESFPGRGLERKEFTKYPREGLKNINKLKSLERSRLEIIHSELKTLEKSENMLKKCENVVFAFAAFVQGKHRNGQPPIQKGVLDALHENLRSPAINKYNKALAATEAAYQRVLQPQSPA